jgi:hypothetical protein
MRGFKNLWKSATPIQQIPSSLSPPSTIVIGWTEAICPEGLSWARRGIIAELLRCRDLCAWTARDRTITDCRMKPAVPQTPPKDIRLAVLAGARRQGRRRCTGHHCRIGAPQGEGGGRSSFPSRRSTQPDRRLEESLLHPQTDWMIRLVSLMILWRRSRDVRGSPASRGFQ